ncbi:hypothetical protein LOS05_17600 [Proteus mirabilis]|nr:hypothetical protein [Proteus mirabilis]
MIDPSTRNKFISEWVKIKNNRLSKLIYIK